MVNVTGTSCYCDIDVNVSGNSGMAYQSDLMRKGRKIAIVTTAAIPWFTGTAVNPLLRAAYLFRMCSDINNDTHSIEGSKDNENMESDQSGYCYKGNDSAVTLIIPWLVSEDDRFELYGSNKVFSNYQQQEAYIRTWLREEANMPEEADPDVGLKIIFYDAIYNPGLKSIFPLSDISSLVPKNDADICILEEPEHLNWFHAPENGWMNKFNYVIGIIHTNYVEYANSHYSGILTAPAMRALNSATVRACCHVVIKLSDTLQTYALENEKTVNVHGVRAEFLNEGRARANVSCQNPTFNNPGVSAYGHQERNIFRYAKSSNNMGAYFIGKMLWIKGLDKILELEKYYRHCTGDFFPIDIYGDGPEEDDIIRAFHTVNVNSVCANEINVESAPTENTITGDEPELFSDEEGEEESKYECSIGFVKHITKITKRLTFESDPIPATFHGRVDHVTLNKYDVFINPSLSEVLCTTTFEALAMGKFVIIPIHPSNEFFMQFKNCLGYRTKLEFVTILQWTMSHTPAPLTADELRMFTWEAALDRLVQASAIKRFEALDRREVERSWRSEKISAFYKKIAPGARVGNTVRQLFFKQIIHTSEEKRDQ